MQDWDRVMRAFHTALVSFQTRHLRLDGPDPGSAGSDRRALLADSGSACESQPRGCWQPRPRYVWWQYSRPVFACATLATPSRCR